MDLNKKQSLNRISVYALVFSSFSFFFMVISIIMGVNHSYIIVILSISSSLLTILTSIIAFTVIKIRKQTGITYVIRAIILGVIPILFYVSSILNSDHTHPRNVKRISDIKQIQTALELYKNEMGRYPEKIESGKSIKGNDYTFMEHIPSDRLPNDGNCPPNFRYNYTSINNGESYTFDYCLGVPVANLNPGYHTATPNGLSISP